ncbi:hypothetical protein Q4E93_18425 [Flavitalea sp. BT771]|uniref:hypothetical protein n=1 Tax=Flavitalea sp. BT771 TaxID=3063329 RepID=UPI0026E318F9|nr:hypothetical protein [Flavitalea sp. BT771]MDO6432588.1 hypothetical protein [Flavitalea sp. BT771]MDV6222136.1 hypothetical protein [Flavitalea sp. BT771]
MISTQHIAPRETNISAERPYRPLLVVRPPDLRDRRLPEDPAIGLALRLGMDDTAVDRGTHDTAVDRATHDTAVDQGTHDAAVDRGTNEPAIDRATHEPTTRPGTHEPAVAPAAQNTHPTAASHEALQRLITGDNPFLLLPETPDDSLFEVIALCMFGRQYIRMEDRPVLAGQAAPSASLIQRLQAQGWPEIRQWNTRHAHWLTGYHQVAGLADSILSGAPHTALAGTGSGQPYVFIEGQDPDHTIALEEALHRHCAALLQDNPPLQALLTEKHQLQKTLDNLQNKHRVLQERMHNAETTINIIRNKYKDDYDTLFSWYQQEYEALPLWYKRLGHVIKVLTGKRTAKSLVLAIRRRLHRHTASRNPNGHQKKDRT